MVIQVEGAVTLQLEARKISNPDDQVAVVKHVATGYKALIDAPIQTTRRIGA
ncbi:hypothetical protein X754_05290 [Mesorhizobium sp. LNJC403B00]|nr:hypothetical protein X754_05290 [Mesorhizobium sp. LNJC403B00]